jgi:hypothetical protein
MMRMSAMERESIAARHRNTSLLCRDVSAAFYCGGVGRGCGVGRGLGVTLGVGVGIGAL